MMKVDVVIILIVSLLLTDGARVHEPLCLSRYDYESRMLEDMVNLKKSNEELRETVRRQTEELARISLLVKAPAHVAFYAQLTGDIIGITDHQTLPFDRVMINIGNAYNGLSGVFTAPSKGVYMFYWVNTNAERSYMNTELIVKNQVYGKAMSDAMDHKDYAVASNLAIAQLELGDQVWVRSGTWHSGKLRGDYYSTFSGYRLH